MVNNVKALFLTIANLCSLSCKRANTTSRKNLTGACRQRIEQSALADSRVAKEADRDFIRTIQETT